MLCNGSKRTAACGSHSGKCRQGALAPPWADAWLLPGQGSLQLLLFLGQLHLELSDLGLQLGDLVIEVGGVPFQLPTSLLQLLTLLLLSSEAL